MRYVIASSVETDEIHQPDGSVYKNMPGGCGIYALAGIKLFTDNVTVVSGIGRQYLERHGKWYEQNNISRDYLHVRGDVTPTTIVTYFKDGSRIDEPNIGLWEFREMDPAFEEIKAACGADTLGIYTFKHFDKDYLDKLISLKKQLGCKLMWEISSDAAIPENLDEILHYLKNIDIFSLNFAEACDLFGTQSLDGIVNAFSNAESNWVFLRRGANDALMLAQSGVYYCPSIKDAIVVDTTGGGNSSSAAALYAMCEGFGPQEAGIAGAVAASYIIAQYGPPKTFDSSVRKQAVEKLKSMINKTTGDLCCRK